MAPKITSSSPAVMMPPPISRLAQVHPQAQCAANYLANEFVIDDVKDIYKRLEGKDLVIEERKEEPTEE